MCRVGIMNMAAVQNYIISGCSLRPVCCTVSAALKVQASSVPSTTLYVLALPGHETWPQPALHRASLLSMQHPVSGPWQHAVGPAGWQQLPVAAAPPGCLGQVARHCTFAASCSPS